MDQPNIDQTLYLDQEVFGTQYNPKRQLVGKIVRVEGDDLQFVGTDTDTKERVEVTLSALWPDVPVGESPLLDHNEGDFHVGGWMVEMTEDNAPDWWPKTA